MRRIIRSQHRGIWNGFGKIDNIRYKFIDMCMNAGEDIEFSGVCWLSIICKMSIYHIDVSCFMTWRSDEI